MSKSSTTINGSAKAKIFNCRNAATTLPTRPIVSFRCTVHCCCAKVPHHEAGFDAEEQAMEDQERRTFLRKSGLAVTAAALGDAVLPVSASAQSPNAAPAKAQEMPKGLTRNLARFIVTTRFEDLPENVRHEAKRTLLNWVGCAIGACRQDTVTNVIAALAPFAGPGQATLLGRPERMDILNAALVNGISSHVLDFDDTHPLTTIHPAAPVAPALLALAEHQPVSGRDFVLALVLGVEAACRIGKAVVPAHYERAGTSPERPACSAVPPQRAEYWD